MTNDLDAAAAADRAVVLLRQASDDAPSNVAAVLALVNAAEALAWDLADDIPHEPARVIRAALERARFLLAVYAKPLALREPAGSA